MAHPRITGCLRGTNEGSQERVGEVRKDAEPDGGHSDLRRVAEAGIPRRRLPFPGQGKAAGTWAAARGGDCG